jgi:hypothetical protein
MYNMKCMVIPVVTGATVIVTRALRKNLEAIPGKHSIDSLQKTAILGTSHTVRKVLQSETWCLSGGDHRWFKTSNSFCSLSYYRSITSSKSSSPQGAI